VWNLRSVPNLVQISVIVTEIDALMLKTLFDDVTGINFRFRPLVTWSSPHGHDASSHKIWCRYLYAVRSYWQFSEIFRIFRLWEFGHSDVLIVWHLCSVPNWVKIYAVVTEIDDLCIRRLFDDVTPINFRFRLLVAFSSPHGRDAYSCKIWCRYLYPVRSYWHFSEIQDGGRRHLGFSDYVNLATPACW